jgi:hypothetical protein
VGIALPLIERRTGAARPALAGTPPTITVEGLPRPLRIMVDGCDV